MDHIWIIIGLYMDYLRHHGDIMISEYRVQCFEFLNLKGLRFEGLGKIYKKWIYFMN